jgi:hypothetical protein
MDTRHSRSFAEALMRLFVCLFDGGGTRRTRESVPCSAPNLAKAQCKMDFGGLDSPSETK